MIAFDAVVEPDDVTTYVRGVPAVSTLQLLNAFPRSESTDNTVDFAEIVKTNRTAQYRSFDGRVHVSKRDGGTEKKVKLAPLSTSLQMGEPERLQLEFARNGGTATGRLAEAAYNDAEQLTREVQAPLELAWGDVLVDGVLSIPEIGGSADYGMPGTHLVAPAVAWTDHENATPLSDLQSWNDVYRASNGFSAGSVLAAQSRRRDVLRNKEVIDAVYGSTAGRTRVTLTELDQLLAGEGLPTFAEPYDTSVVVDDVETRVIPENRAVFLPPDLSLLGSTVYGVSATALELVNSSLSELSFEDAAGIVGVIIKEGPPFREFTYVDAVAMPVLSNARRLLTATVAA
jgi:hypothetical protein